MMRHCAIAALVLSLTCAAAGDETASRPSSAAWLVAGGVVMGVAAVGAGAYLLIRHLSASSAYADSIIAVANARYRSAAESLSAGEYAWAKSQFEVLLPVCGDYAAYVKQRRAQPLFSRRILRADIDDCTLLASLLPRIRAARKAADGLPASEEALAARNRHAVLDTLRRYRSALDSLLLRYPKRGPAIRRGFAESVTAFDRVDTMFARVYAGAQYDFGLKCKFHYNQAMSALPHDTTRLREFVEDCDYYHVDKQWCEAARTTLGRRAAAETAQPRAQAPRVNPMPRGASRKSAPAAAASPKPPPPPPQQKAPPKAAAVVPQAPKRAPASLPVAAAVSTPARMSLEQELYERNHPSFADGDYALVRLKAKGLAPEIEAGFRAGLDSVRGERTQMTDLRFPAGITADYSAPIPVILFNVCIDVRRDVTAAVDPPTGTSAFVIPGVDKALRFLRIYKARSLRATVDSLRSAGHPEEEIAKQTSLLSSAIFVVRLWKDNATYITKYAREQAGGANAGGLDFYDFFDVTIDNHKDLRIPSAKTSAFVTPNPAVSVAGTAAAPLLLRFFGK